LLLPESRHGAVKVTAGDDHVNLCEVMILARGPPMLGSARPLRGDLAAFCKLALFDDALHPTTTDKIVTPHEDAESEPARSLA
jgi:hypothetical protein